MNKDRIIDYIYDEMSPAERLNFESEMALDKSLKSEVEKLLHSRSLLSDGLDYLPPKEEKLQIQSDSNYKILSSRWWILAASLVFLLSAVYFSGLRVAVQDGSLIIGFNQNSTHTDEIPEPEYLTKEEFYAAFSRLEEKIAQSQTSIPDQPTSSEDINEFIQVAMRGLDRKYKSWTEETLVAFQDDTRNQTESLIQEFLDYYEIKRADDIKQINAGLTNLALMVQESAEGLPMYALQPAQ